MVLKEIRWSDTAGNKKVYEEIPNEELWEDGELSNVEVQAKIINHVMQKGDWILIRRIDG
tara:strand:+ start:614 stop:793 length:180 start_codon:yes stop_codon:yes gene_type:complete